MKKNKIVLLFILVTVMFSVSMTISKLATKNSSTPKSGGVFGIDVSHYQGRINWSEVKASEDSIKFVFIRSTMGVDGKDKRFQYNWKKARAQGFVCGAYHYYRPNENSTKQFNNYAASVKLRDGDFMPILDVESASKYGTENLRKGVLNWLRLAEEKYGRKPMVYTGNYFYWVYLAGYIDDYPHWISCWTGDELSLTNIEWDFRQFTQEGRIDGIKENVDGNYFKGELIDLKNKLI